MPRSGPRRIAVWTAWIVGIMVGVPLLLVLVVLAGANTDPGRRQIEALTASLTGGMVRIQGLAGRFPDSLRVDRIEVSDPQGAYVVVEDTALDWSPTRLLWKEALIERLDVRHVDFRRLPNASGSSSGSGGGFNLPVRIVLRQARVARLDIGAPVAGEAVALQADGAVTLESLSQGNGRLTADRLGSEGRYALDAAIDADRIKAVLTVREPEHGLISGITGLPALGAIAIDTDVDGPRDALATKLAVHAGPLRAEAHGTIDLDHLAADMDVAVDAPAMAPRPDINWQTIHLVAKVKGPFTSPEANGTLHITELNVAGAGVGDANAAVSGNAGTVRLHATLDRLRVPGPRPDLLADAPLMVDTTVHLDQADRPVEFAIRHRLLSADGSARTAGALRAHVDLTAPDLAPLAAIGGVDVRGNAHLLVDATQDDGTNTLALTGTVGVTGGMTPIPALVGDAARIDLKAAMRGADITLSRLQVDGKAIAISANGGLTSGIVAADWAVKLADLAAVHPTLSGPVEGQGRASGTTDDLAVVADITADIATTGYRSGQVTAHVDAKGLPSRPAASLSAEGLLLDSPLHVALDASQGPDGAHVTINRAAWKSLAGHGSADIPTGQVIPTGHIELAMARLADLAPLLDKAITGSIAATLDSDGNEARAVVSMERVALPGTAAVAKAVLNATVADMTGQPVLDGNLSLDGVSAGGIDGGARLTARGPMDAVALTLGANSPALMGAAARIETVGVLNSGAKSLSLSKLAADWKTVSARLLQPVKLDFADGVAVDRLRLGIGQAELQAAGRAGSALDLTASLRNLPADIAAIIEPSLAADGIIAGEARLTGTPSRPEGTVTVTASRVRLRQGPGQVLPPANLKASAKMNGTSALLDTKLTAGTSNLAVIGTAPLGAAGNLDLHTTGSIDLAMLDPLMAAQGRRVRGQVGLDAAIAGTMAEPRVNGTAKLSNGDVQDFALGAHVSALSALVRAEGDVIRLASLTGKAGEGSIGGSGTVGLAGDKPIDLRLTANNARPLSSDLLTAVVDANLYLRGALRGDLSAGGEVHVRRADIRVPEKMPVGVAVLKVTRPGEKQKPPVQDTPPPTDIALDLTVNAPQQVFIRGRGIDAELGGNIHVGGTAANPRPDGGLQLRRGTLSVIGQTLTFSQGSIDFNGAGISDPALKFVANATTQNLVATLTVRGSAKDPKIVLSSVPDAPQDEILAQLLFNTTTSKLSPLQLAQIAAALASLSGAGPGFGDPLESLRSTFGLDRLSVGSSASGSPTLEAGRYLARGVYLGAKQSASGTGSQATVQIDIAKGLKLETTAGTGSSSATGAASRSDAASVGLTYQFEY